MTLNMEFDQMDIPFDMQFGDWLPASPGDPNAVHFVPQDLTEEEKAQARENIGAMPAPVNKGVIDLKYSELKNTVGIGISHKNLDDEQTGGIYMSSWEDGRDENDDIYGVLEFESLTSGGSVILKRIHDGINDNDAATVGQLNAIAQAIGVTYVGGINTSNPVALADLTPGAYYLSGTYKKVATEDDTLAFSGAVVQVTPLSADSHTMSWRNGNYILQAEIGNGSFTGPWVYTLQYKENCVTTIDDTADDEHYPTAKAVDTRIKDNTLVVTLSDDGTTASHTAAQIYEHIQNGGTALLFYADGYLQLQLCSPTYVSFGIAQLGGDGNGRDDKLWAWAIDSDGQTTFIESDLALQSEVEEIKTALDTLTEHATYTKLYDRVEITADDVAAAGEEGIMEITIGSDDVDLSQYSEILVKVYIPKDEILNTAIGLFRINWSQTANGEQGWLLSPQSTNIATCCGLQYSNENNFMVKMAFTDDTFLYGQVMKNGYGGSWGYAGVQNAWTCIKEANKKSKQHYFHIADRRGEFKLPAGSYVEVYGR